ncbi:hypothetical protein O9992_23190 [Vibrio lentus]|nr:hypothetical protein [Vibrio lentus]
MQQTNELNYGYVTADDHGAVMGKQQWRMLVEEAIVTTSSPSVFKLQTMPLAKPIARGVLCD